MMRVSLLASAPGRVRLEILAVDTGVRLISDMSVEGARRIAHLLLGGAIRSEHQQQTVNRLRLIERAKLQ